MINLSYIGRTFYGIAIAGMGLQMFYDKDFPYMLIPPDHASIPGFLMLTYISGMLLFFAGAWIVFAKKNSSVALLLGSVLLLIFCFYYVPYELIATSNYMHWGEWENAEKELALSAGAFVMAECFLQKNDYSFSRYSLKLLSFGAILFSLTMICFGIAHFLYIQDVLSYMPAWVTNRLFWGYLAGIGLFGSGIAIILKIKVRLCAVLLGAMIFSWFIILHIPKVIAADAAGRSGEITSALLAFAYSGIAFVIAAKSDNISQRKTRIDI